MWGGGGQWKKRETFVILSSTIKINFLRRKTIIRKRKYSFYLEKSHKSGPTKFKTVLFQGQLHKE